MNEVEIASWYKELVDDCKTIITEAVFTSRWALVEGYWQLGKRIRNEKELKKWEQNKAGRLLQDLAKDINTSTRTIHYSLQVYDKYPDINKLPEGKNISWNKLITKYLPQPKKPKTPPLPDGKYDVIVIDPPWQMEKIDRECSPQQSGFDYATMSIDEIKAVQLPAGDNCHLFLWTTQKYLPKSFDVLLSWGFNYIFTMVWHKNGGFQPFNLPQYNCEFILYARKGTPVFSTTKDFFTCFSAKRTGHSEKPEEFYDIVRRVTDGKRIDMFNRRAIDGFDVWGNECQ